MGTIASLLRWDLTNRQGRTCAYCGRAKQKLTLEHIHPVCYGGKYDWINLVISCRSCNHRKGNLFLDQFLERCPRYRAQFERVVNDNASSLTRRLIVFYMARPILDHIGPIRQAFGLSERLEQVLSAGLWSYFDRLGPSLGIPEWQARSDINQLKQKLQVRSLRGIYVTLWQWIEQNKEPAEPESPMGPGPGSF